MADKTALFSDVELREYFASVIGAFRQPFGVRGSRQIAPGEQATIAANRTDSRVLSVTVSRADTLGPTATVIFSSSQSAGDNDFPAQFPGNGSFRFVLKPGDILTLKVLPASPAAIRVVVGQETF